MKFRHLIQFIVILATLLFIISNTYAQMSSEFWITLGSDSCQDFTWHLLLGNHINASYEIDSLNPTLQEREMPPAESCLMAKWINIPGRINSWGNGLIVYDFRGIPIDINQKDTFLLYFVNVNWSEADVTIRWPKVDYLTQRCDSMFFVESTGQIPIINAFNIDSLIIPDATDRNITKLFIYKYGCKIIDDVNEEKGIISTTFSLSQNYPNPFNPSTQITFSVPKATYVTLKVYDILGRQVAVLVDEKKVNGEFNVTWNAEGVPSGVYFYRIVAGDFIETKKMVIMK